MEVKFIESTNYYCSLYYSVPNVKHLAVLVGLLVGNNWPILNFQILFLLILDKMDDNDIEVIGFIEGTRDSKRRWRRVIITFCYSGVMSNLSILKWFLFHRHEDDIDETENQNVEKIKYR